MPGLDILSDAAPSSSRTPAWLSTTTAPPARLVALRLPPQVTRALLDSIVGLAAKYDLVLYDARSRRIHTPLDAMAAHATATFWPSGAIQAAVAGGAGVALAVAAWILGIPVLSGVLVLVGGFLFVMAVYTFIHEGRKAARTRRSGKGTPADPWLVVVRRPGRRSAARPSG